MWCSYKDQPYSVVFRKSGIYCIQEVRNLLYPGSQEFIVSRKSGSQCIQEVIAFREVIVFKEVMNSIPTDVALLVQKPMCQSANKFLKVPFWQALTCCPFIYPHTPSYIPMQDVAKVLLHSEHC